MGKKDALIYRQQKQEDHVNRYITQLTKECLIFLFEKQRNHILYYSSTYFYKKIVLILKRVHYKFKLINLQDFLHLYSMILCSFIKDLYSKQDTETMLIVRSSVYTSSNEYIIQAFKFEYSIFFLINATFYFQKLLCKSFSLKIVNCL